MTKICLVFGSPKRNNTTRPLLRDVLVYKPGPSSPSKVINRQMLFSGCGERYGMTGIDRAVLYRVAIETGFRANELKHLTVGCFNLKKAIVKLDAKFCKDRRDAVQFITLALAKQLEGYFDGRGDNELAFSLSKWTRTAEMIQEDAIEAKVPVKDKSGLELVFQSTRHSLETELSNARITQAVIDRIIRHKPQGIGQRIYTHVSPFQIRSAVEKLPAYPWPGDLQEAERAKVS